MKPIDTTPALLVCLDRSKDLVEKVSTDPKPQFQPSHGLLSRFGDRTIERISAQGTVEVPTPLALPAGTLTIHILTTHNLQRELPPTVESSFAGSDTSEEDEPLRELEERWRLHWIADPDTDSGGEP
jgi:hypothetical protein